MFDKGKQESSSSQQMKEWLGLLDDKERAEVLKVQIAEEAKTERERIERENDTRQRLHQTEGYHVTRGLFVCFLLALTGMGTCLGYNHIEKRAAVDTARIEAEHPRPAPPPPASAKPAPPR